MTVIHALLMSILTPSVKTAPRYPFRIPHTKMRNVMLICVLAATLTSTCGEPQDFSVFSWEVKSPLPNSNDDFGLVGASDHGLYISTSTEYDFTILLYEGGVFREFFSLSKTEGEIQSGGFFGDTIFLGVSRPTGVEDWVATLLRLRNGAWVEVARAPGFQRFYGITAIDENSCWLVGVTKSDEYKLLRYHNDILQTILNNIPSNYPPLYSKESHISYLSNNGGGGTDLWVAGADGMNWCEEVIQPPAPYKIKQIKSIVASPAALYIVAYVESANLDYRAIIKRTGPPGEGVYEFSYLGWVGPGIRELSAAAFRDDDHGVAIGLGTSMSYNAPAWTREPTDNDYRFELNSLVADPRGGYWAIHRNDLIWHP